MFSRSLRKYLIAAALVAAGLAAERSEAGMKLGYPLTIDQGSRFAMGSMADVRNSGDSSAYIACETSVWGGSPEVWCVACNSQTCLSCYDGASSPNFQHKFNAAASLKSDSRLYFYADSNGRCNTINVSTGSYWSPKSQ